MSNADPRIAARLRDERKARGMVVAGLAEHFRQVAPEHIRHTLPKLKDMERTIRGHESGEHAVGPRYRLLWSLALDLSEEELFNDAPTSRKMSPFPSEWDEMERRLFLQLAATMSLGSLSDISGEPIRQLFNLAASSSPRDIEDWSIACADHLHAIRTRHPAEAREDLIIDLLALQEQLQATTEPGYRIELQRVVAALSVLHANLLTRLGSHGAAIRWWRTAKSAAEAANDLDLQFLARASEAGFGLYGQRSPEMVLHLAQSTQRLAPNSKSVGMALSIGAEAKALTLLGRHQEATKKVDTLTDLAPVDGFNELIPTYWTSDQVAFAESWVRAGAGDEAGADNARDRVLAFSGDYQYVANVRLHEALCTVVNGGIDSGISHATAVVDALPTSQQSFMIVETAKMVIRALPPDKHERSTVREFRQVLASKAESRRALPGIAAAE